MEPSNAVGRACIIQNRRNGVLNLPYHGLTRTKPVGDLSQDQDLDHWTDVGYRAFQTLHRLGNSAGPLHIGIFARIGSILCS